jgi:DNA excision repair protein ERCC-2
MPTGTGKTVCLLSLILSFIKMQKPGYKLIYCTRTIVEMEKTLAELKFVLEQREKDYEGQGESPILAMCLSSRKNLCIHEKVSQFDDRETVDSECRARTASWVREKASTVGTLQAKEESKLMSCQQQKKGSGGLKDIEDLGELCGYYEGFMSKAETFAMPKGVYTLEDLRAFGVKHGMCPYFLARHFLLQANVIVYNYSYMLDPKISNLVSKELQKDCIVVFDECHNIDNACIEAFSLNLNRKTLDLASSNIKRLEELVKQEQVSNTRRLQEEYHKLIKGLFNEGQGGG